MENSKVECATLYGEKKEIAKEKLSFRISGYAVITHNEKILLVKMRRTNKYFYPGGGIEIGEETEDGIIREVKEETGLDVKVQSLLHFKESFFYYDPWDTAWHCFLFFFNCKLVGENIIPETHVNGDEDETPIWINAKELKPEDFQHPAEEVFEIVKRKMKTTLTS